MNRQAIHPVPSASDARADQRLGAQVIGLEYTLISVMIGVMLFKWIDFSVPILREGQSEYWLYSLADLLFIMWYWTEVTTHTFAIVGWPLTIGRSLIYIFVTATIGINLHFIGNILAWWISLNAAALGGMAIIYYDYRILRQLASQATGASAELYAGSLRRQIFLLRIQVVNIAFVVLAAALILALPRLFIDQHWHLVIIVGMVLNFGFILWRAVHNLNRLRESIRRKTVQDIMSETG